MDIRNGNSSIFHKKKKTIEYYVNPHSKAISIDAALYLSLLKSKSIWFPFYIKGSIHRANTSG